MGNELDSFFDEELVEIHGSFPSLGNWVHSRISGHMKSNVLMIFSHSLALSHKDLHGRIGTLRVVHSGKYSEHKNGFRSGEQLVFIKGINWYNSRAALF